jgi:hypothetical protein
MRDFLIQLQGQASNYNFDEHLDELHDLVPSLDHRSSSTRQCHSMHEFTLSVPRSRTSHHQKSFSLGWFVVGILFLVQYFQ